MVDPGSRTGSAVLALGAYSTSVSLSSPSPKMGPKIGPVS